MAFVMIMFGDKKAGTLDCKCGHDVMLHGFQNMGCSVMLTKASPDGKDINYKCSCNKFERRQ